MSTTKRTNGETTRNKRAGSIPPHYEVIRMAEFEDERLLAADDEEDDWDDEDEEEDEEDDWDE